MICFACLWICVMQKRCELYKWESVAIVVCVQKIFLKRKVEKKMMRIGAKLLRLFAKCCELEGPPEIPQKPFEFHRMVYPKVCSLSICFPQNILDCRCFLSRVAYIAQSLYGDPSKAALLEESTLWSWDEGWNQTFCFEARQEGERF